MGNEISSNPSDLESMRKYSGFSPKQVELIKERFEMLCDEDLTIDKEKFAKLMRTNPEETNRLFEFFDTDSSGKLDCYEFICGLALISQSSLKQKAEIIFNLYDFDKSKLISQDEMVVMVKTVMSALNAMCKKPEATIQQAEAKTLEILKKYDTNKDGEISLKEFQSFVSKDPEILRYLTAYNLIAYDDLRPDFGGGEGESIPEVDSDLEAEIKIKDNININPRTERIKSGIEHTKNSKYEEDDFFSSKTQVKKENPTMAWLSQVKNLAPNDYKPRQGDSNPPESTLQLDYVYGYRCHDCRNNLRYGPLGEVVYHTAAVGIMLDPKKNSQQFFMEHNDDIISMDIYETMCITGQVGVSPLLCIWDLKTMQSKVTLKGVFQKGINNVCFSNDGRKFAAAGLDDDHCVAVYDLEKTIATKVNPLLVKGGKSSENAGLIASGKTSKAEIFDMKFEPMDKGLVAGCLKEVLFLNFEGGVLKIVKGVWENYPLQAVLCLTFVETNLVTGMFKGELFVWKGTRPYNAVKAHTGPVNAICTRKSSKGLITGSNDGMIIIWEANLKKVTQINLGEPSLKILNPKVRALCELNNNILVGTRSGEILEFLGGNKPNFLMRGHYSGELWGLAMHPNSSQAFTIGEENLLVNWDLASRKPKSFSKLDFPSKTLHISADCKYLAVGCLNGSVLIIDPKSLSIITTLKDRQSEVTIVKFSPLVGGYLAVAFGSPDHELFIYNIKANFKIQSKLKGSSSKISHLDFSEDSAKLQFSNVQNEIFFYDVKSGKREPNGLSLNKEEKWASWTLTVGWPVQGIWPPYSEGGDINSVDRSLSGDTVVSADDFGKVKLFRYPSCKEKAGFSQFLGHSAQVTAVRFSFKNEYILSLGGADKSIFQWRYLNEKQVQDEVSGFGEEEEETHEDSPFLFDEEVIDEGDQFMAVKPFKGEVEHSIPSWFKPGRRDNELPSGNLSLRYVHGFRCFDMYNGARYGKKSEIVFVQAALGVVMDTKANKTPEQSFFQMHEEDIISLSLHPKLNIAATGQMAKRGRAKTIDIYVWDIETKAILSHMNEFHLRAVNQLSFSPDGAKLLSVGQDDDNSLAIHDWQAKIMLATSKVDKAKVSAVAWRNETSFVTIGPKHIKFWTLNGRNVSGKRGVFGQGGKTEPLVSVTFGYSNNQYCVTGSKSGNIYVWTGESASKPLKAHNGEVSILLSNKQSLYSGGDDGVVNVWSFGGGGALARTAQVVEVASISKYRPGIRSLDIKADGTILIGTRGAELYEGKQGINWTVQLQGHYEGEVWGCSASPSSYRFATCGGDRTVRLWDIQTKKMVVGSEPFEHDCRAIDWAVNGKFLVIGDVKGKIYVLDAGTLQVLSSLPSSFKSVEQGKGKAPIDPWIEDIKISPNCLMVAFGAHAGASNVEIMGINNNKLATKGMIKAGLTSALTHLDWSNDSEFLVINSQAYELKFANVSTLKPVSASSSKDIDWATWTCVLGFYSQGIFGAGMDGTDVNSVCRANNRKLMATGDDFGKVNLFKYPSVVEKSLNKQYAGHSSHVTKVKFAFDDCFLMSVGGNDKAVIVWETDFGAGDQNKGDMGGLLEKEEQDEPEEEIDKSAFLQRKKKVTGADKFKQYKEGFVPAHEAEKQKKQEKKPEDDIYGEEEDKGDESMTIKPWMTAIKEPQGYIKPPLNQEKPPTISLELTCVHGYRSKDSRNNVKYLKSGTSIVYPAAAVGVVLDLLSNKQRYFTQHNDDISALEVSPDGLLVATGELGPKATIFVWDSNTMMKVFEFRGVLSKGVSCLAFSPSGEKVVASGLDDANTIAVFDLKVPNGALLASSKSGNLPLFDLCFKNEAEFAEVGSNHLRFWSFTNKTLNCKSALIPNTVSKVLVVAKYNQDDCVIGDMAGNLQVWKENIMIGYYKLHDGSIDAIAVQPGYVMTGGRDSIIKVLDKNYLPLVVYVAEQNIKFSLSPAIRSLCFSSDCKNILIGTLGGEIYEIQTKDNKITNSTKFYNPKEVTKGHFAPNKETPNAVWGLAVFPDGDLFCTVGDDATLRVWSSKDRKQLKMIKTNLDNQGKELPVNPKTKDLHDAAMGRCIDISPDGKHIAVGFKEGTVKVYESDSLEQNANFKCSKDWISVIRFSPDNKNLAIGSHDSVIYIYSVPDYKKKAGLRKHASFITHLDWSDDSNSLHSNCGAFELLYWDIVGLKPVANGATQFRNQNWATWTCALGWPVEGIYSNSSDGTEICAVDKSHSKHPGGYNLIAVGDDFGKVRVLRYPSRNKGSEAVIALGHSGSVTGVKWSVGDEWLYSIGGEDCCVFQWRKVLKN